MKKTSLIAILFLLNSLHIISVNISLKNNTGRPIELKVYENNKQFKEHGLGVNQTFKIDSKAMHKILVKYTGLRGLISKELDTKKIFNAISEHNRNDIIVPILGISLTGIKLGEIETANQDNLDKNKAVELLNLPADVAANLDKDLTNHQAALILGIAPELVDITAINDYIRELQNNPGATKGRQSVVVYNISREISDGYKKRSEFLEKNRSSIKPRVKDYYLNLINKARAKLTESFPAK